MSGWFYVIANQRLLFSRAAAEFAPACRRIRSALPNESFRPAERTVRGFRRTIFVRPNGSFSAAPAQIAALRRNSYARHDTPLYPAASAGCLSRRCQNFVKGQGGGQVITNKDDNRDNSVQPFVCCCAVVPVVVSSDRKQKGGRRGGRLPP